jgi:thiamine biosynthesis lipoprotein
LDFNAIAKGFCVDKIAELLSQKGISDFLVEVGGEITTKGTKFGKPWVIGIQAPTVTQDGENNASYSFAITNKSIATSGNYRNYIEEGGRRFTHIIDPKNGYPEETNLLSVTVIADDCATADAFATAFMVMGIEKTEKLLQFHPELAAFFIYSDGTQMLTKKSTNFP